MEFEHYSVLLHEAVKGLQIRENGVYVDGTLGGGGHSHAILSENHTCRLIGIDQDDDAHKAAARRLEVFAGRFIPVKNNFKNVKSVLSALNVDSIDGAVLDLGVSSYQLDEGKRGFSYMHDAALDMRMDQSQEKNACDVINTYTKEELCRIFFSYGEEKWSKRIAEFIVKEREKKPILTTGELVRVIKAAVPAGARAEGGHPAKRIFQAVRIEVNGELELLEGALRDFISVLKPGARLCVITFHSLEDRIVKKTFSELAKGCICPKSFPICVCHQTPQIQIVTKRPILPSDKELEENSRSKSAKLRIAQKQ